MTLIEIFHLKVQADPTMSQEGTSCKDIFKLTFCPIEGIMLLITIAFTEYLIHIY